MNKQILPQENIFENEYLSHERYAGVLDRIKAIMIDSAIIIVAIVITSTVLSSFNEVPDIVRIVCFLFIFLLYDPLSTALLGGTIGHRIIGLRVKREWDESKNINLILALARYIAKIFLGWVSLLTVTGNARKRAIHDQIVGSVVIYFKINKQ